MYLKDVWRIGGCDFCDIGELYLFVFAAMFRPDSPHPCNFNWPLSTFDGVGEINSIWDFDGVFDLSNGGKANYSSPTGQVHIAVLLRGVRLSMCLVYQEVRVNHHLVLKL